MNIAQTEGKRAKMSCELEQAAYNSVHKKQYGMKQAKYKKTAGIVQNVIGSICKP